MEFKIGVYFSLISILVSCPHILSEQCVEPCLLFSNQTGMYFTSYNTTWDTWKRHRSIYRLEPISNPRNLRTISMLYKKQEIITYDSHSRRFRVTNIYNSNAFILASARLQTRNLVDFTVDWQKDIVYWTDDVLNCIRATNLNGTTQVNILQNISAPSLIEYSSTNGSLIIVHSNSWNSKLRNKLSFLLLGGSLKMLATASETGFITSIALDHVHQRVYYIQNGGGSHKIYSVSLLGGDATLHYSSNSSISSLTFGIMHKLSRVIFIRNKTDVMHVEISNEKTWEEEEIKFFRRINSMSDNDVLVFASNTTQPEEEDTNSDLCSSNKKCQGLCITARTSIINTNNSVSKSNFTDCRCPLGQQLIMTTQSCKKEPHYLNLYILEGKTRLINYTVYKNYTVEENTLAIRDPFTGSLLTINILAATESEMFFVDNTTNSLWKVSLLDRKPSLLVADFPYRNAYRFEFDFFSRILFVVPANKKSVVIVSERGHTKTLYNLNNNSWYIADLVLMPRKNMFAVLLIKPPEHHGWTSKVTVFSINGSEEKQMLFAMEKITTFTYHPETNTFYLYSDTNRIYKWNMSDNRYQYINTTKVSFLDVRMLSTSTHVYFVTTDGNLSRIATSDNSSFEMVEKLHLNSPSFFTVSQNTKYNGSKCSDQSFLCRDRKLYCESVRLIYIGCKRTCGLCHSHGTYVLPCLKNNGGCSHFCLRKAGRSRAYCACPDKDSNGDECRIKTDLTCQDSSTKGIKCNTNESIEIVDATYGRFNKKECSGYTGLCKDYKNVTSILKHKCDGMNSCTIEASNKLFGDPCVDIPKYLTVRYKCIKKEFTCEEPNCIYFSANGKIQKKGINGTATTIIERNADFLAADQKVDALFWSEKNSVYRSTLSGKLVRKINFQEFGRIVGLAIDRRSKVVYWADYDQGMIFGSDYDGNETIVMSQAQNPKSLTIDEIERKLFWLNDITSNLSIMCLDLHQPVKRTKTLSHINDSFSLIKLIAHTQLKLLILSRRARNNSMFLSALDYNGQPGALVHIMQDFIDVVVNPSKQDFVYLLNNGFLLGYNITPDSKSISSQPMDAIKLSEAKESISIIQPKSLSEEITEPCNGKGNCSSGICINENNCQCGIGKKLEFGNCLEYQSPKYVYITVNHRNLTMFMKYDNGIKKKDINFVSSILKDVHVIGIAQNPRNDDIIYLLDKTNQAILELNLQTEALTIVNNLKGMTLPLQHVVFDYEKEKFYWSTKNAIYRSNLKGGQLMITLIANVEQIKSLDLDSEKGILYYGTNSGKVYMITLNAGPFGQPKLIIDGCLLGFKVDIESQYILCANTSTILKYKLPDGGQFRWPNLCKKNMMLTNYLSQVRDFTATSEHLYFISNEDIRRLEKRRCALKKMVGFNTNNSRSLLQVKAYIFKTIISPGVKDEIPKCDYNNGGCSHVCVNNSSSDAICRCPVGMKMNIDAKTCFYEQGYCNLNSSCTDNKLCVDEVTSYHCKCFRSARCSNNSQCVSNKTGLEICQCHDGYYGDRCQYKEHCLPEICQNGGTCREVEGDYNCTCPQSYVGRNCETILGCSKQPCKNKHCLPGLCQNGGTCREVEGDYNCTCPQSYVGRNCETILGCSKQPCKNDATCEDYLNGTFKCNCGIKHTGKYCNTLKDCFRPGFCMNGGECILHSSKCICKKFYTGNHCGINFQNKVCDTTFNTKNITITHDLFRKTMAKALTDYCKKNIECLKGVYIGRVKRDVQISLTFTMEHIIVVRGYPKEVGIGQTQVMYAVVIPKIIAKTPINFLVVDEVISGTKASNQIFEKEMGSSVASARSFKQTATPAPNVSPKSSSIPLITGVVAAAVVIIVLIVTIGYCYSKKKTEGNKDVQIQMTDRRGRVSITTVNLSKKNQSSIVKMDTRYTDNEIQRRPTFGAASLGLLPPAYDRDAVPPPPDYNLYESPDTYEGIENLKKAPPKSSPYYLDDDDLNSDQTPKPLISVFNQTNSAESRQNDIPVSSDYYIDATEFRQDDENTTQKTNDLEQPSYAILEPEEVNKKAKMRGVSESSTSSNCPYYIDSDLLCKDKGNEQPITGFMQPSYDVLTLQDIENARNSKFGLPADILPKGDTTDAQYTSLQDSTYSSYCASFNDTYEELNK